MAMAQYGDALTADVNTTGVSPSAPTQSTAPTLPAGIGNAQQANQASQFMRAQPWYQDFLKSQGQDPNHVKLTKDQAYQLLQLARKQGVGISTKYSLDSSGNIVSEGMPGWEKAVIIAGVVAGGILLAPAVIAAMGGEAAASATAAAAAAGDTAAAGTLATAVAGVSPYIAAGTIGLETLPPVAAAAAAAAAPTLAATLASNAEIPSAVSDVGAGSLPTLASTATVPTATGTIAGGTGIAPPLASATLPTATGTVKGGTGMMNYGPSDGSVIPNVGSGPSSPSSSSSILGDVARYAVPTAGSVISGLIQANAQGNASAAQQKYLEEALAYEKQRDAAAIALEGSRYANYSGNIAPYLATGNSANTRMSSLLGLPASPTTTAPSISYQPSATSTAAGAKISAPTAAVTTGSPLPRATNGDTSAAGGALVTMQAPDGSTKQVDPSQVAHFQSMGAQVVA